MSIFCTNCLYKSDTDMRLYFDNKGFCTGCQNTEISKTKINWDQRLEELKTFKENKSKNSQYDLVICKWRKR